MKKFVEKVSSMSDVEQIVGEMRKSGRIPEDSGMMFILDENSNKDEKNLPMNNATQQFRINITKELSSHQSIYDQSENTQSLSICKEDFQNPRFSTILHMPQPALSSHHSG